MGNDDALDKAGKFTLGLASEFVPLLGLAVETIKGFIPDNDQAMKDALLSEVHSDLNDLRQRVAKLETTLEAEGKKPQAVQPTQMVVLWRTYFEGRARAYSERQREAIKNAFVAQFDPRKGDEGRRKYWLDLAASLTDNELEALDLLKGHDLIRVDEEQGTVSPGSESETRPVPFDQAHPVAEGLKGLVAKKLLRRVRKMGAHHDYLRLSALDVLLSYIDPPKG